MDRKSNKTTQTLDEQKAKCLKNPMDKNNNQYLSQDELYLVWKMVKDVKQEGIHVMNKAMLEINVMDGEK